MEYMAKPLVSIGMPVYNGERFIRQALDSLLAQDYENFELIISDNASVDKTQEICLEYAARDKRIRYYRNEKNMGAVWNFNRVFELSKGKYFMWAAHDDLWDKTYIRKCVEALEQNPSAVLCCTSLRFIDKEGKIIYRFTDEEGKTIYVPNYEEHYDNPDLSSPNVRERVKILAKRHGWYAIYGLIRTEALRKTRLFQTVYGPDVILLIELCLLGPFIKIQEVLFFYRSSQQTEKDRAAKVSPYLNIKPSRINLGLEIAHTILISKLPSRIKFMAVLDFASSYLPNSPHSPLIPIREKIRLRTRIRNSVQKTEQIAQSIAKFPQNIIEFISQKTSKGIKCAVIEYNYYHGEVLPTIIYILNSLGIYNIDVYVSKKIAKHNPFVYSPGLKYNLREIDILFFKLLESLRFQDYDLLIFNSIEPKEILQRILHISVPTIAIVHNGSLLKDDNDYINFFKNTIRKPIVLSPHISKLFSSTVEWIWCLDVFEIPKKVKELDRKCFCVQGNIVFQRRNYESLIDAVEKLISEDIKNFHILIVGRNDTKDGLAFKQIIKDKNLDKFFTFSKGEITYKEYYDLIAQAHFILPLIDKTKSEFKPFFFEKNSSSIHIAFSFGIVPIIHEQLAQIYEIEDSSIKYADGRLADALKQAINIDKQTLQNMQNAILSKKENLLNQSILNMKRLLNELGFKV
ncbi:MAG: glycosyltransferase family 2 protein [Nitrososphaerota archaeon]